MELGIELEDMANTGTNRCLLSTISEMYENELHQMTAFFTIFCNYSFGQVYLDTIIAENSLAPVKILNVEVSRPVNDCVAYTKSKLLILGLECTEKAFTMDSSEEFSSAFTHL